MPCNLNRLNNARQNVFYVIQECIFCLFMSFESLSLVERIQKQQQQQHHHQTNSINVQEHPDVYVIKIVSNHHHYTHYYSLQLNSQYVSIQETNHALRITILIWYFFLRCQKLFPPLKIQKKRRKKVFRRYSSGTCVKMNNFLHLLYQYIQNELSKKKNKWLEMMI